MTKIRYAFGNSRLGVVLVAVSARGLCAVLLGDEPLDLLADLKRRNPGVLIMNDDAGCRTSLSTVVNLIERPGTVVGIRLDLQGTTFQKRVWAALVKIPVGRTMTYSQVAAAIGQPKAVRSVGRACAENPLAVVVPCHRVVRTDGSLSGYRWGSERKRLLLHWEATK